MGAAATVRLPGGRRLVAQVDGGSGHSGKRAPEIHFGLGNSEVERVEVQWPDRSGTTEAYRNLEPGTYLIRSGEAPKLIFKR